MTLTEREMGMNRVWGIHNDALGAELVEKGFVSVGWEAIPDLLGIGPDRESIKDQLRAAYPTKKEGTIRVWGGVLHRFAFEMQPGDLVVAPFRPDSTLNFGVLKGPYFFDSTARRHPHRRRVKWLRTGVARGLFPQAALNEIGSAVTTFQVRNNDDVFRQFLNEPSEEKFELEATAAVADDAAANANVENGINAARIEEHTQDFIVRTLHSELTHEQFEHFVADLLRAMGYQARVTPFNADGGVDILAHRDPLGLEPPLIKVQCKHTTTGRGRPDVQQLIGRLASGEVGLFVTLGSFSSEAVALERERQTLRLFGGADITKLTIDHYQELPARWRDLLPLRSVMVVDRPVDSQ